MTAESVYPDLDAVNSTDFGSVVGALLTIVLLVSVLMLIVSAVVWAVSASAGNFQTAGRARVGVWVSLGSAALCGALVGWINFLLDTGRSLT